jgi:hypothetical protein
MSRYSHAALYVGGTAIEATLEGVFSKNPQRMIFEKSTDVLVLRVKRPLSIEEARVICSYAQSKVGSLYALNEAITVRARSLLNHQETKQQFCSRLVALSFKHANFDLANIRNAAFCTPRQLSLCKAFQPVIGIVRPAREAEIHFANTEDPARENLRQIYDWLDKVRELVTQDQALAKNWDIQAQNDVNDFLLAHPEHDEAVSNFVDQSGYLEFYKIEAKQNSYRYNPELFMFHLAHAEDQEEFLDSEIDKERELVYRYASMQEEFCKLFKKSGLRFFKQHVELYTNLVSEIVIRMGIIRDTLIHLDMEDDNINILLDTLNKMVNNGKSLISLAK